ncbi:MAG: hypothetical protein JWN40_1825 [Phycisphaerales bacterium]|nr:hypothetical protein [Phycisphaerales bacterium]
MRNARKFALALVALAMFIATSARAQVLTMVPADAMVVFKIKNMQDVSAKVATLSQQWGLVNIRPELNDPLGTLLTAANLGPGLNKNGEAAVAVLKPEQGAGEPRIVAIVSVTDYKTFATSLPNAKADGDVTTFGLQGNPQPMYVKDWGKYAAISNSKEMVAAKGTGVQAGGVSAKELASKDLIVFANMKAISKEVLPQFQQMKPQMLQMMDQGLAAGGGINPKYAPVIKAYMAQIFDVMEGFLRDSTGAAFGINLTKDGISTTLMAEFEPGSYGGKAIAGMKNTDASFTAGLPDGKYFMYGGMTINPATDLKLLNDFVAPMEKELTAMGAEGKPMLDYLNAFRGYIGAAKQTNFGLVAPPANAIGQQGLIQMVNVIMGDTAKLTAAQKQMMATQGEIMKITGAGDMVKTSMTPAAKTVDGVTLDSFTATVNMQPQTPQEQQAAFMLQMLYGPKGLTGYSGPVGTDKMVTVAGGDDALLSAAIQAAKNNSDPLGKGVAAKVSAGLPQNRLGAFYLPLDTIATTVLDVMAARGMPGGVKLPPNLPPLAWAVDSEGSAIRVDGYIPAQTVQSLIAAGMQMWLQGMNGGGAGQPGGL